MTLKHIEFTDSEVLRELERLAADKGDYTETDLVKTASATVESYEPSDDLFSDVIRLASGLRARGMGKQADELENKLFVRQSAKKKMEESKKDDGEKLLDQAHPEGDVEISPSSSGLGKVWTEQSAKREILKVVQKAPTGKYAQSVLGGYWQASKATQQTSGPLEEGTYGSVVVDNIIKAASDALGVKVAQTKYENVKNDSLGMHQLVSRYVRPSLRSLIGHSMVSQLIVNGETFLGPGNEIGNGGNRVIKRIIPWLAKMTKQGYDGDELLAVIKQLFEPRDHMWKEPWYNSSTKTIDIGLLWDKTPNATILGKVKTQPKAKEEKKQKRSIEELKRRRDLAKSLMEKLEETEEIFRRLSTKYSESDKEKSRKYARLFSGVGDHLDDIRKKKLIVSERSYDNYVLEVAPDMNYLNSKLKRYKVKLTFDSLDDLLITARSHARYAGLSVKGHASVDIRKTAQDVARKRMSDIRVRLKALDPQDPTDKIEIDKLNQELATLEAKRPAEAGKPTGKPTGKRPVPGGSPHAGYKQGSVSGMQRALHALSDALKNHAKAARVGKTGESGRAVDNDWGTETSQALTAAEEVRKQYGTKLEIKTQANRSYVASNITAINALTEYVKTGKEPAGRKEKGKLIGTYKTPIGNEIQIGVNDISSLRSLLNLLQDQGAYIDFKAGGGPELDKAPKPVEEPKTEEKPAAKAPPGSGRNASRKDELRKLAQSAVVAWSKDNKGKWVKVPLGTPGSIPYQYDYKAKKWNPYHGTIEQPQAQNELGEGSGYTYDEWLGMLQSFWKQSKTRLETGASSKVNERAFQKFLHQRLEELKKLRDAYKVVPGSAATSTVILVPGRGGKGGASYPQGNKRRKGRGAEGEEYELPENSMTPPISMDIDLATSRWTPIPEKWQIDINLNDWVTTHATDLASQYFSDVDDVTSLKSAELKYMKGHNNVQNFGWNGETHNIRHWTKNQTNAQAGGYKAYQIPHRGNMRIAGWYKDTTLQQLLGAQYMDYMQTSSKAGAARELQDFITYLRRKMATVSKEYLQDIKGTDRYDQLRTLTKRYHSKWNEVLGRKHREISTAINSGDLG